eukprot:TRINITY_DN2350_c0_g1_i1.p1 TRINITY_DN2350_c0_g1~~TRINITY_DN2350_c0_g1_i1.p1  ORF type:complete len:392 (+),score=144.97 TRINITY_DN2350_c0_g1_i1:705-1880(+)
MKIFVRTLTNQKYELEVELSEPVESVKEKIHAQHNLGEPDTQKLIYSGKILQDGQTLGDAGVKEGGFLVLMIKKEKPVKEKKATSTAPAPAVTAPTPAAPTSSGSTSGPAADSGASSSSAPAPAPSGDSYTSAASHLVRGPEFEETVMNIMAMGYERDEVIKALQAAFNNPERAVEYLISGIPAGVNPPVSAPVQARAPSASGGAAVRAPSPPRAAAAAAAADQGDAAAPPINEADANQLLQDVVALRQAMQSNPALLDQMVNELTRSYPDLVQQLGSRENLVKMLQDPAVLLRLVAESRGMGGALGGMGGGAGGMGGGAAAAGGVPPGATVIRVTEEEKAAIERLEALGFSRRKVLEAFLACDRNEELAANYLFEHGYDDEEMGGAGGTH